MHGIGVLCGLAAGVWLGAAEAPTKLVNTGLSPYAISLCMVAGVFTARWSLPTLVKGTRSVFADLARNKHLIPIAILAGMLWGVANTLTVFAIRDVGLAIAFPLWNTNSLVGILWGRVLFGELKGASGKNVAKVLLGALAIVGAAIMLGFSTIQGGEGHAHRALGGILAAAGASLLWGTMYIPYRKAYLTGMNPLSFITFFTVGEVVTMLGLAIGYRGRAPLWHELSSARAMLFWLMLGGFVWVIGDLFQQYATKYVGISRGIPLSNTNQLWGLLWGILVFDELRGASHAVYAQFAGGSLLMAAGAVAIALSSATEREHSSWRDAAGRESRRYSVEAEYVQAGIEGRSYGATPSSRSFLDWLLMLTTTALFIALASVAQFPRVEFAASWAVVLTLAMLGLLAACGLALWRTTGFR
jgi:glucose uptake protein GlcU